MFNFLNYNTPYMSGTQTARNSYRPTQRGFDSWGSFVAEPEPVYYYEPRATVHSRGTPYYDDEYIPRQAPVRNTRPSHATNRRPMNQSTAFGEPTLSQIFNEPKRVQRPQQRPQQQPRVTKQPTQERTTPKMPQNANTRARRTQESAPQEAFSFFDMFGGDPFFGNSRAPAYRPDVANEHSDDEGAVGSSHTPVETTRKGPAHTQKAQQPKTNVHNKENEFEAANNMRQQQKAQPQAKAKASAQPKKAAQDQSACAQPKVVQIASSQDPRDLVTIEDETPVQQRLVEGKQPSNGLVIEEVNPQQS